MAFEDEVFDCILKHNPEVTWINDTKFPELLCKLLLVHNKNIVFHLLPIPFAGLQNVDQNYFQKKSLDYSAQNIQLVHLWQDYWVTKQDIVRSRIAVLSGSCIRIHARQTKIQRISKDVMRSFFTVNHLQGPVNARYNYGLYAGEVLVAAASFSSGRTMMRQDVPCRSFELLRYASLLNHRVVGGLGKLISCFVEDVNPDDIMTYADLDWASCKGYRTLHFEQIVTTTPQMFWIHPSEMIRYYPHRLPAQLKKDFQNQNQYNNINDFLIDNGYFKIYNSGNAKFIYFCNR